MFLCLRHRKKGALPKTPRKPTFYHASPKRFRHGDILVGEQEGGAGTAHPNVCMTTSVAPHATIAEQAARENWFVYQVTPLYSVRYMEDNAEFQT